MLEKDIERKVCEYAKTKGCEVYKFTSPSHSGVCDRIFVLHEKVLWIEFKALGKKPTPLQTRHHQKLAALGHRVYVVDSVEQGKEIIDHETQSKSIGHHRSAVRVIDGVK